MEQIDDEPLKNQLATYRKKRKFSQRDAALYTNVSNRQKIARYERGTFCPVSIKQHDLPRFIGPA